MAKSDATKSKSDGKIKGKEVQDVEQIREILFGGQMRDYEHRFAQMEQVFDDKLRAVTDEFGRRLSKLEEYVQGELKSIHDTLARERKERRADADKGAEHTQALQRELQEQLAEVQEKADEEGREMRAALHNTSAELGEAILSNRDQIEKSLNREANVLHDEKVSRVDMAELFSEVALRLKREFEIPEK